MGRGGVRRELDQGANPCTGPHHGVPSRPPARRIELASFRPLAIDRRHARWAVVALTLVGGALRVVLAGQDLFGDELATYWIVSTRSLTGVVETVSTTAEITPPLSFVLTWFATRLGDAPELVRLPSLVAGIATIPLVYAVGRRTVGEPAALVATALTTLSPFMAFYAAEARGYGVLMALLLLSTLSLLRAVEDGGTRWWILYAACTCLAAYTHYTGVFVLAGQLGWAAWTHPRARRPLLLSTAVAVLAYLPWLPSLKGDLDSPTTLILAVLSPFDPESVRVATGLWVIGFPAANIGAQLSFAVSGSSLRDFPGTVAVLLLAGGLVLGTAGAVGARRELRARLCEHDGGIVLVAVLALATPAGTALQSAIGTNVFRTRSLAASWPYLALAIAALVMVGGPAVRRAAAALVVAAFALAAVTLTGDDLRRPDHSRLASVADDQHPGGVIVNGASFTPGPLTNFDVPGTRPHSEVLRLNVPEQDDTPFTLTEARPDPVVTAQRAVAAANGGPITVIAFTPPTPIVDAFLAALPATYERTDTVVVPGIFTLQALVYERVPS